ncbi:uncharacterized protein LOC105439964 [Strongylocentrotus purpuratus]|uniref:Transmembrane protein n=1 Tax=Strongylocentrotus purpuratus TaxID=7668 RepID=A0A7M7NSD6_STRPU|nr:uncharacterized protein LOC105439964 [Strongylocentrotus purpuratus]|eukprot:XP_011667838.1 PREDICTED: uncharacterized protein LOC105439964 [Strongylocentrotus purpuratus]
MEGKYTDKAKMNEGYDGPSTSTSPPSGSDRPSKSDDDVVNVDTHVKEASNDIAYDGDLEKGEGNSRVCYVCRIVSVLACIAISVFMVVWFSAIEAGLTRTPSVEMSPPDNP